MFSPLWHWAYHFTFCLLRLCNKKEALETYLWFINMAFGVGDTPSSIWDLFNFTILQILFGSHVIVFPLFSACGRDGTLFKFNQQDL